MLQTENQVLHSIKVNFVDLVFAKLVNIIQVEIKLYQTVNFFLFIGSKYFSGWHESGSLDRYISNIHNVHSLDLDRHQGCYKFWRYKSSVVRQLGN